MPLIKVVRVTSFLLFTLYFVSCTNVYQQALKLTSKNDKFGYSIDRVWHRFSSRFEIIVGYGNINLKTNETNYLVGINQKEALIYKYQIKHSLSTSNNEPTANSAINIDSAWLTTKERKKILQLILKENILIDEYNDVDIEQPFCGTQSKVIICNIMDGVSYKLIVETKNRSKISKYYEPEFFENRCCPGNINRQYFLSFKTAVDSLYRQRIVR